MSDISVTGVTSRDRVSLIPMKPAFMKRLLLLLFALFFLPAVGQPPEKRSFSAYKLTSGHPAIDGLLDEEVWAAASWENRFTQHQPDEGAEPSLQTSFAVLYDLHNLYVGMKMFDSAPDSIVRRLTRRDRVDGDVAGVEFDSYDDKRTAFAFALTAAGVKYDFIVSNDGNNEDDTWNPIWWAAASHDSLGWYAEMRIPLTQLRFGENKEQEWGFEAVRYIFRKEETSLWQPVQRSQPGFVSQFGRISGLDSIESHNIADIMPYVVARSERFEKEPGNPFRSKGYRNNLAAGLDAKIGITNYLTLDLTVNPDFGQVEADPSEVNLSTYETFFGERRPFFIEGKNILHYGLNFGDGDLADEGMFYSRRIGRPPHHLPDPGAGNYVIAPQSTRILGAAKLTGKTAGGLSVGLLESMTAKEYARTGGLTTETRVPSEPFTNYAVARIQQDFDEGNTCLGGIATSVNRSLRDEELMLLHRSAYAGGVDLVHKWNDKNWELDVNLYGSRVAGSPGAITQTQEAWSRLYQRPDATYMGVDSTRTSLSGYGGMVSLGEFAGKWRFLTGLTFKSPGLELNDVGYLREADNLLQVIWVGYRIFNPVLVFREFQANLNQWTEWNFGGDNTARGGNFNLHTSFLNYWYFEFGGNLNLEGLSMNALRGGPALRIPGNYNFWGEIGSDVHKKLTVELEGYLNESFVRDFSYSRGTEAEIAWKPLNALSFSMNPGYDFSRTTLQYITRKQNNGIPRYLFGTLDRHTANASFRVNLNLTPELTIQYWGQPFIASGRYSDLKRITDSRADKPGDRYRVYDSQEISYDPAKQKYLIEEAGWGATEISQPDFNVKEFLSNMVLRWEYAPGSTFYLVWSQGRHADTKEGSFKLGRDLKRLFDAMPENIILLKLSYRIGR